MNSAILDKAIVYAVKAHSNTERRGKGFPYIVHPMEAVSIVATMTSDQDLLAAAALHDVVEDTDITVAQIREEFGDHIAYLVEMESDKFTNPKGENLGWKDRKLASLERLASAPKEVKIVAMGDKLSNMRAIAMDYRKIGDVLWDRFHAPNGKIDHEWRYRALVKAFDAISDTDAYKEFSALVDEVFAK
ncbi:MAG: bifunctional (p)ppGpp synthetase/guanosine-3',5'-bis(diphosphate) 3'-pyrophosphohydrolase [Bacteroidales bacterium]|nr:bifunctional (p)ppGpp synthetase/guanosine-3',5'-bis(diphosphate) 3'-pyrophosphohydrolase [Candidatus Colimorpha pelethequi]